jgi:hypothetical protein
MRTENPIHPVIARLDKEEKSKNRDNPSGRELCGILVAYNKDGPLFFQRMLKTLTKKQQGGKGLEKQKQFM